MEKSRVLKGECKNCVLYKEMCKYCKLYREAWANKLVHMDLLRESLVGYLSGDTISEARQKVKNLIELVEGARKMEGRADG